MSKRKLLQLVEERPGERLGRSAHADARRPAPPRLHAGVDPRLRRAGRRDQGRQHSSSSRCSSTACARISTSAPQRRMAVLRPLKLIVENYPDGQVEEIEAVNNPEDPGAGTRKVPFIARAVHRAGRLPRSGAAEVLPPLARRRGAAALRLHRQVHRRHAGCRQARSSRCAARTIPTSRGGDSKGRKVKGTIHWVSAAHAVDAEVRLYDTLFTVPKPDDAEDYASVLNPQVAGGADRRQGGAGAGRRAARDARAVRAHRLLRVRLAATTPPRARSSIARSGYATRGRRSRARGKGAYQSRHIVGLPRADAVSEAWRSDSRGIRARRAANERRHGVAFVEAITAFHDPLSITIR